MTQLSDIYSDKILELAGNMEPARHLASPDGIATAHSRLCGSKISVELNMCDNVVTDYAQTVKACLLGQSAAAIVAENIVGTSPDEFAEVADQMRAMLKRNGPPPSGKWAALAFLEPVKDYPPRHASTLLVFDAVQDAMAQVARTKDGTGENRGARAD